MAFKLASLRNSLVYDSANSQVSSPKHVTLPKFPAENELIFEAQAMILFIVSMITQYLNLYPTVWWMSQSNANTALISPLLPSILRTFYTYASSLIVLSMWTWAQIRCAIFIYSNHGITGVLYILYPMAIYLLMFCPNIIQAYESSKNTYRIHFVKCFKAILLPIKFSVQSPIHSCSSNPEMIRDEVDKLKSSFNDRLKFILFRSLLLAYYSSFIPLCFTQPYVYYDISWTAQHVGIAWLSAFLMLTSHLYSPQFYDILHKSSLHLGKWQKLETRNTLVPCNSWSDGVLYAPGVVVRHSKEYFKAEGVVNSAEPGNQSHLRYYIVFSNPVGGFGTLIGLLVFLVFVQIVLLVRSYEWHRLISMSLLIVVNSLTVFRLVRSYYVLKEVYRVEAQLQETNQQNLN
ncbi:transmembrane protein 39A-A-like protein [Leptotrombidium deliense]|uniref:Transmembrane protein 39A-A-like protein n=1 Tax=Leptotrombidium deliense TaxID=299467 RepID=A0A443SG51_9ACAR|nr:transmembrane protein 39A-A-like protein [Leptotrombidium deliense]